MTPDESRSLHRLREILWALPPTGPSGFEGLVAACLTALTGQTFRLAKSGLQFGRDASTAPSSYAIAMEAKRYQGPIRLEDVAGKAVVFSSVMGGEVDVWVLATTSEVGEGVVHGLHQILAPHGVELLTLDWSQSGPPALAVLLAAHPEAALRWLAANAPPVDADRLERDLVTITRIPGFSEQKDHIEEQLNAAHVGLGTLATEAHAWLMERLSDEVTSQRAFGQFVSVANPVHPAQPRDKSVSELDAAITRLEGDHVLLVHGEEGVGKTWVVAQWWAAQAESPILIFVSGRRVDLLEQRDPEESLARLLADQHPTINTDGWKRRLGRWRTAGSQNTLRFVLVLDGVNEHPHRIDWADVIRSHVPLLHDLGGAVVVTSRTGFWHREVAPRLGMMSVEAVEVCGYSELELAAELASAGADAAELPPHVRDFVRNPRVCSVAKHLLANLAVQPEELTIERLLVEYWRSRLAERGSLARHNITDFDSLLRAHAREWLREGKREFDLDSWSLYSGAVRRVGLESVLGDLSEIGEGRFLTITSTAEDKYAFRHEALPYALGLLIVDELRTAARDVEESTGIVVDEVLARILDPVRGFDRISDVLAAAIGIAGWGESTPDEVFRALVRGWCALQNTTDRADGSALRHAAVRPDAVLDVAEQSRHALPPGFQAATLVRILLGARELPSFAAALEHRIPRWLGSWSIAEDFPVRDEAMERRQAEREERVRSRLAALTDAEQSYLQSATFPLPSPPEITLQRLSALLLARRPLASYAPALLRWGFAQAIAGSVYNGSSELAWVIRLNRIDPAETTEAVRSLVAGWDQGSSPTMARGAAYVLRLLGDDASARRAQELQPLQIGEPWRLEEEFPAMDPCDPDAQPPTDLSRARRAVEGLRPDDMWTSMGLTSAGHELEYATQPLARFEPEAIIEAMRSIAATASNRSGLSLRQISFRLPALSSILDGESLGSVGERFDSLVSRPEDAPPDDFHWILCNLLATALPHMAAAEQVEALQGLPSEMPSFLQLGDGLTPVSSDVLETYLSESTRERDDHRLLWLLFHAASSGSEPTERVRSEVVRLFMRGSDVLARIAASYVSTLDDRDLNDAIVDDCLRSQLPDSWYHRRAFAHAVVTNSRSDAVHLVPRDFMGFVADAMGGDALLLFSTFIDQALDRALSRDEPSLRGGIELHQQVSETGLDLLRWGDEKVELEPDLEETLRDFNALESAKRWERRQQRIRQAIEAFERELANADAQYLAWPPQLRGLKAIASQASAQLRDWLIRILETDEPQRLGQVRNLGLAIASAYAGLDSELAATGFRKLASVPSVWNVNIDGVDLYTYALFSAADGAEIDILRREKFLQVEDDKAIAELVFAAERHAPEWLDEFTPRLTESPTPADHALAITIEGFRLRSSGDEAPTAREATGFLGASQKAASESSRRSEWCEHWLRGVQESEEPGDFWRFTVLAQGAIDPRQVSTVEAALVGGRWARFANPLLRELKKSAEKVAKERERTLFGIRAPDAELRRALFPF